MIIKIKTKGSQKQSFAELNQTIKASRLWISKNRIVGASTLNFFSSLAFFILSYHCLAQDVTVKINIHGVFESKISLLPLSGISAIKPIIEIKEIKNGETVVLSVSKDILPGEFVLRFDYKEKEKSTPYPSEKRIFIGNQNIEYWVNPMYTKNNDSAFYQKDEQENTQFTNFNKKSNSRNSQIEILQSLLMNYDDTQSLFYQQGIQEYEKRRNEYNQWLTEQKKQYHSLFVSHTFQFHYIPKTAFKGSEYERIQSVLSHYFDGLDFTDSLLINTSNLKDWMNNYVNIYGTLAVTDALRDSLLPLAGKIAIEKARLGNPKVYGWMVDYFYNGFESFNITSGIKMLGPYLDDPNCLTTKRQAIEKRLTGIKTLLVGTLAPDFTIKDDMGDAVQFHNYKSDSRFKLLLFWSADCGHCKDLVGKLYPWYQQLTDKKLLEIFALSLDETVTEIPKWESAITHLQGWKHIRCDGGINSKEANAYFILSTPVMILVDTKTNKISAIPENLKQLIEALK